jgi:hypothetical protein
MNDIELIKLKEPHRFSEWVTTRQERISFLMDTMFTMCEHYPDTELVFSLDPTNDDVLIVEPYGSDPYRFRLSEYLEIEEMLQPYQYSASYREFIRSYRDWRNRFRAWWRSYSDYIKNLERSDLED